MHFYTDAALLSFRSRKSDFELRGHYSGFCSEASRFGQTLRFEIEFRLLLDPDYFWESAPVDMTLVTPVGLLTRCLLFGTQRVSILQLRYQNPKSILGLKQLKQRHDRGNQTFIAKCENNTSNRMLLSTQISKEIYSRRCTTQRGIKSILSAR